MSRFLHSPLLFLTKPKVPLPLLFQTLFGAYGSSNSRVTKICWDPVGLSSNKKLLSGFRTFCTSQDLSTKNCVPCTSKDLRPMTEEAANNLIPQAAGWSLVNESGTLKLKRSWKVKSFTKGLEFIRRVADIAEAEGHHPDLHLVGWNNVTIDIWTHSVGGLTENDFILASKISKISIQDLLSRKVADKTAT